MGCGVSKYDVDGVGTCGVFSTRKKFPGEMHTDKLLLKEGGECEVIESNHSRNSFSSTLNNANITVREAATTTTTTTVCCENPTNKFGGGEKETKVDRDEKGGNKDNKVECREEEDDDLGRRISDFDGSLIGSPSFREYCTIDYVSKDRFKDDGNSDGEDKETKVKGGQCNVPPRPNKGWMTISTRKESRGRRFRKVFPMGGPSAMKKLLVSASRGRHGKPVENVI